MKAASTVSTNEHPPKDNPSNEQLCAIARTYILEEHARVGDRIYYWDNWNISVGASANASEAPPDDDSYSWATTLSCDITSIEVSERNDCEREYIVTVSADIRVGSGNNRGAETESQCIENEKHVFYCHIKSIQDEYFVTNVEE